MPFILTNMASIEKLGAPLGTCSAHSLLKHYENGKTQELFGVLLLLQITIESMSKAPESTKHRPVLTHRAGLREFDQIHGCGDIGRRSVDWMHACNPTLKQDCQSELQSEYKVSLG